MKYAVRKCAQSKFKLRELCPASSFTERGNASEVRRCIVSRLQDPQRKLTGKAVKTVIRGLHYDSMPPLMFTEHNAATGIWHIPTCTATLEAGCPCWEVTTVA